EEKEILGDKKKYYVMKMPIGEMRVMVPVDNVEEIGIREIITNEEMNQVFNILRGEQSKMPQNWNRRYRMNMEKIKSGDINEIAKEVKNKISRDYIKREKNEEIKMLNNTTQMQVS